MSPLIPPALLLKSRKLSEVCHAEISKAFQTSGGARVDL